MKYSQISLLKFIAFITVVFYHCAMPFDIEHYYWRVYSPNTLPYLKSYIEFVGYFCVPAFLFCSGFLFCHSVIGKEKDTKYLLKSKTKRLIVPYLKVGIFYFVPMYFIFKVPVFAHAIEDDIFTSYLNFFKGDFVDHLWFIHILFFSTLFWIVFKTLLEKRSLILGLIVASCAYYTIVTYLMPLEYYHFNYISGPILYMYLGALVYQFKTIFDKTIFCLFTLVICALTIGILFSIYHKTYDFPGVAISLLMGLFMYALLKLIPARFYTLIENISFYKFIETRALEVYVYHMPIPLIMQLYLYDYFLKLNLPPIAFIPLNAIATILIACALVKAIELVKKHLSNLV